MGSCHEYAYEYSYKNRLSNYSFFLSNFTGTGSEPISRSTSTEQCNQLQHHLIDSFAQTDVLDPVLEDTAASRDMIDSGVETQQKTIYKERTVSISVEDEPIHLSDEQHRRHYVSVSEEDENISRDDEV